MDEFAGKVALVTGAGQDIGREIALAFSSIGVAVAANDINPINLDETVSQITQAGGNAMAFVFDIAKRMPVEAMLSQVLDHFGHIDYLINQASVRPEVSILEMDEWEFHRTMDVNLGGPFFCIQQVGRVMRQQGGGAIVNMVSTIRKQPANKGDAAYYASQVGLIGLSHAAARELSIYNIRVNTICQGLNELDLLSPLGWDVAAYRTWREAYPNLSRSKHPELVSLALYLCSQAASSLTGQVVSVNL